MECICRKVCHQFVPQGPVAATNLKVAASNRAVQVTDGLCHDVWLLLSPHKLAWVVFGQVTSASCASHCVPGALMCCLGVNVIHGTTWQMLSDGPHCLWGLKSDSLRFVSAAVPALYLSTLLGRFWIYCFYIYLLDDRIQCDLIQTWCFAGSACTIAFTW